MDLVKKSKPASQDYDTSNLVACFNLQESCNQYLR